MDIIIIFVFWFNRFYRLLFIMEWWSVYFYIWMYVLKKIDNVNIEMFKFYKIVFFIIVMFLEFIIY